MPPQRTPLSSTLIPLVARRRARPRSAALAALCGLALTSLAACSDTTRGVRGNRPALGAAAEPASRASTAAEPPRFVYRLTGQPAAGLLATFTPLGTDAAAPPGQRVAVLDAEGRLPRDAGAVAPGSLRLVDPVSGLVLLELGAVAERAAAASAAAAPRRSIALPLPVRVTGKLVGFSGPVAELQLHHGSGRPLPVVEYVRGQRGLLLTPHPEENRAWGLDLPAIASRWSTTQPHADGSFDTGWLALFAAPQLIAADRAGHLATLEVSLPAQLGAHASLDAGEIAPQPTVTLEIDRSRLPATALQLLLQAGVDGAEVPAAEAAAASLRLALLHRLDPLAADFATRRRDLDLAATGVTRIAGLPPFARLDVHVSGPRPGLLARRSLAAATAGPAPTRVARLALTGAELLGTPRRIPLTGIVRFSDGRPAAAATVVYGSYPDRYETRTDRNGAFSIPAVATGREAVLFVDAPAAGKPPFDHANASQRLEIPTNQQRLEVNLIVPLPLHTADTVVCPGGQSLTATDPIPYTFAGCGARLTQSDELAFCPVLGAFRVAVAGQITSVEVGQIEVVPQGGAALASVQVPEPGQYAFLLSYTPFVYSITFVDIDSPQPVVVQFAPPQIGPPNGASSTVVVAVNPAGKPVPDLEIAYSSYVYGLDPYNGLTDQYGQMEIACTTESIFDIFVDSDAGCYEGSFKPADSSGVLKLKSCDDA